jgi:hypothetical protein
MWESYELKFKLIWDRKLNSKIYENYDWLSKDIISFRDWHWRIDWEKIKDFDSFTDFIVIKRNYNIYDNWSYFHITENWTEVDIDSLLRDIDIEEYHKTGWFKVIEEDITYELSKKLWFISNKIGSLKFKNWEVIINWEIYTDYNPKYIDSISQEFLILISSYFETYKDKNNVTVNNLYDFCNEFNKNTFKKLKEKHINKDNIRKTYIPTINNNINNLYKNDKILEIKWSLITVLAV